MKISQVLLPVCGTNCYIVKNEDTNESIIVDPGSAPERIIAGVEQSNTTPVAVLLTHGHFDHAGAAEEIAQHYDIKIYAYHLEQDTLENPSVNLSGMFFGGSGDAYHADVYLKDRQEIDLAGFHIQCLFTPGHTPGGCCYYLPYQSVCFTGDTLFCGSVGRTDFPGGSMSQIVNSIKEKIMTLPEDTICYPGHESATTVESERMYNPYL